MPIAVADDFVTGRLNGAAPEGAERRPPRCCGQALCGCLNGAAPEGAERRRAPAQRPGGAAHASMEPLPKERSDVKPMSARGSPTLPQWSRSRRSGATRACRHSGSGHPRPQWSRSRRSGATISGGKTSPAMAKLPQWSRSRRSGATRAGQGRPVAQVRASMEPLPKERSDVSASDGAKFAARSGPQWSRSRRSGATCGNGGYARGELAASMEPLPKERSDTPCLARCRR